MDRKVRLLIADTHILFAEACQHMLEPEFEVVGIVTDGRSLVEAALALKPNIVILEVSLPQLNGLEAVAQIKRKLPHIKLLFTTANLDPEVAAETFRQGSSGYVPKQSRSEELVTAIRAVARGQSYLSSLIARETIAHLLRRPRREAFKKHITRRQTEILQLLAEGRTMKDTASILNIKPGTVAFHKYHMMASLGIETNAGLIQYAMRSHVPPLRGSWPVTGHAAPKPIAIIDRVSGAKGPENKRAAARA
ncbi:MAG: response regulator transcription factor [Candidatus Korobacteraceae bacterium]